MELKSSILSVDISFERIAAVRLGWIKRWRGQLSSSQLVSREGRFCIKFTVDAIFERREAMRMGALVTPTMRRRGLKDSTL